MLNPICWSWFSRFHSRRNDSESQQYSINIGNLGDWIQQPAPKLPIVIFFFDQLEQVLQVLFVFLLLLNNRICLKTREHSGFTVSKLVLGSSEEDTKIENLWLPN